MYYVRAVYCFECPSHPVLSSHFSTCHRWCPRASIHAMSVRPSGDSSHREVVKFKHGLCPAIITIIFIDIFIIYNIIWVPFMWHILCQEFYICLSYSILWQIYKLGSIIVSILCKVKLRPLTTLHVVFIASIFSLNVSFETGRSFAFSFH